MPIWCLGELKIICLLKQKSVHDIASLLGDQNDTLADESKGEVK